MLNSYKTKYAVQKLQHIIDSWDELGSRVSKEGY